MGIGASSRLVTPRQVEDKHRNKWYCIQDEAEERTAHIHRKGREERLADMILDLYDSYSRGYVTLDELEDCLWEEAGIKFEK